MYNHQPINIYSFKTNIKDEYNLFIDLYLRYSTMLVLICKNSCFYNKLSYIHIYMNTLAYEYNDSYHIYLITKNISSYS